MADYYPVLARAVAALSPNTQDAREDIYERARSAIARQLAGLETPAAPDVIDRELDNLERVIERIEAEQPAAIVEDLPVVEPELPAAPLRPQVQPKRADTNTRKPWIGVAVALGAGLMAIVATMAYLRRHELPAVASRPLQTTAAPVVQPAQVIAKSDERISSAANDTQPRPAPPASAATAPSAPVVAPAVTAPPVVVPPPIAPALPAPSATPPAPPVVAAQPPRVPSSVPTPAPVPVPAPVPAPAPQPAPTAQPAIAIANRLVFVIENTEAGQPLLVRQGAVVWRTESVNVQGQPVQLAIKGLADIPEARMRAELTIQRNMDPALPASHTIQIQFNPQANSEIKGVQSLSVMELRVSENQPGYPISGQGIAIVENLFLIALTQGEPAMSRNIDMMRNRPLVYFEFQATGGRRAAIIMEKGIGGQQAFDDAFRSWQQ